MTRFLIALAATLTVLFAPSAGAPAAVGDGLIAFESDRPDGLNAANDVFTMNTDGSGQTQVTLEGGNEPAWNADGTKIAFSTNANYGDPRACLRNIFAMNPDGTGKAWILGGEGCSSQAFDSCSFNNFPSWSPDGAKIVYAANDCFASSVRVPGGIFVVDVATRTRTRLTTNQVGLALDADPSWSHDGTKIAFARADPTGYHIHVMDADGGNLTQLESVGGSAPDWSPDDSRIAFGFGGISVIDADGSNRVQLTSTVGLPPVVGDSAPTWSSDGSQIAFHSNRQVNGSGDYEIWVMNADGSSARPITDNSGIDDLRPSWQPTGGSPPPPPATGTIRVELDAVPDDPADFGFALEGPSPTMFFTLDDDGGSDSTYSAFQEYTGLDAGTWSLHPPSGQLVLGWQRGISCSDPDGGSSTSALTATIDLDPGETVTCRYTHTKEIGSIRVELDTVPDSPDDFNFSLTGPVTVPQFTLDDDGLADLTHGSGRTYVELDAGSWSLSPAGLVVGWQRGLSCTDPDGGTSTNQASGLASIDLDPGELVTCRYTYTDVEPPILLPIGIDVDATGPGGATVSFAPTASDDHDPSPSVSCSPVSGSLFPIGDTTVDCTATDTAGNVGTGSFTVHVRGAAEQIAALIAKTEAFVDDTRVEAVLRGGLFAASQALAAGRKVLACVTMNAYIAAVRLLPTRILSASQKSQLIADAARIRAVIGC
jgi:Tol biopolymer transport system component